MTGMPVIAIVGSKKSGKTAAIETVVEGLTKRGYKVATAKHIPEIGFSIDTEGKDTWRHAKAGARTVLSVAPNELVVIRKMDTTGYSLEQIVAECDSEVEIMILEGFKTLIAQNPSVPKIVAVKTTGEVLEARRQYTPILTFVGPIPTQGPKAEVPYVDVLKEPEKLVDLVVEKTAVSVERKRGHEKLEIQIDGRDLPLNPFVQEILRNTIVGMISNLRDATLKGDEKVSVVVEGFSKRI